MSAHDHAPDDCLARRGRAPRQCRFVRDARRRADGRDARRDPDALSPGGGPPLHVHANDEEQQLLVEGLISYFADGCWTDVEPGGVYFPKGAPHSYRNGGTALARHWVIMTRAGFERFIARFTKEQARLGGAFTLARADEIGAEYGYTHLGATPQ